MFRRRSDKAIVGFAASGHSGYGTQGNDVVCAAISALTVVTVLGLEERLGLSPAVKMDEESGFLECRLELDGLDEGMRIRTQDLLETLSLGLAEIQKEYPKYLKVKEVAV